MKKLRWLFMLIMIVMFVFFGAGMAYRYNTVLTNEDFIRFHVIANSDSAEDQALKLKIRDRCIEYINGQLVREAVVRDDGNSSEVSMDIDESRIYIMEHMDEIVDEAEAVVIEEGADYNVRGEFGVCWIPEKTYGSVTFPAGNYEALRLIIGEGSGQNWWCVLYPPLCLIDTEHSGSGIDEDVILSEKYDGLMEAERSGAPATTLKLRFKSIEMVKKFTD